MSVYAVADLHGQLELWKQIQDFLEEDDVIYVIGDCGDRGPEPWETIKAVAADHRAIYIKGNHEDMLVKAMEEWYDLWDTHNTQLLYYNGGQGTLEGWIEDGAKVDWINYLKRLPNIITYTNKDNFEMILSHAGFTPNGDKIPTEKQILWDREHFNKKWTGKENQIIVHGHTNIVFIMSKLNKDVTDMHVEDIGAFWYCDNHKVGIDCGSYITNTTVLLDLDTFDQHIFSL